MALLVSLGGIAHTLHNRLCNHLYLVGGNHLAVSGQVHSRKYVACIGIAILNFFFGQGDSFIPLYVTIIGAAVIGQAGKYFVHAY